MELICAGSFFDKINEPHNVVQCKKKNVIWLTYSFVDTSIRRDRGTVQSESRFPW